MTVGSARKTLLYWGIMPPLLWLLTGVSAAGQTMDRAPDLAEAARSAVSLPRLHSLLVSWRGNLILEYYARGMAPTRLANIKSASKSIISTLVGIALERRLIKSVDEPIAGFFPGVAADRDARKKDITIEDLLTMRSGLESTSGGNYGRWVRSPNWVQHALSRPLVSDPGRTMQYSTGSSHLLSAILTRVSGTNTWQFAQDMLARPLGITLARWPRDPQGIYFGGNEMLMTPRQMLAFGELYLNRGRHNGAQVVPAAWVDTSCTARTESRFDSDRRYGYGWWMREFSGGRTACFAWGFGGQYILVFRDIDLVIAATSSTTVSDERRGHRQMLFDLIERHVLDPIAAARR
jgi:CubicO group peptidase (beta-lactamase class C family)